MHHKAIVGLLALLLTTGMGLWTQGNFYLKDSDRVVFYGTAWAPDQRLYTTLAYVVTRFPQLHVTFVHSGVGGRRHGRWGRPHRYGLQCSRTSPR